jgi:hypothetical protein
MPPRKPRQAKMSDPEYAHAHGLLPYTHPVTGETADSFAHLVRLALRALPPSKE